MLEALSITAGVMVAEIISGLLANSLALLSDAGHMLTDILALGMSLVAMRFTRTLFCKRCKVWLACRSPLMVWL